MRMEKEIMPAALKKAMRLERDRGGVVVLVVVVLARHCFDWCKQRCWIDDFGNETLECAERNSLWVMRIDELQFILWESHRVVMMRLMTSEVDDEDVVVDE